MKLGKHLPDGERRKPRGNSAKIYKLRKKRNETKIYKQRNKLIT
jgi:hypothetical protein